MIRLIATDLDGTLFYPKKRVFGLPYRNRVFLRRFLDDGGQVVLVSGRSPKVLPKVERILHHPLTLIGCNGGYVYDDSGLHDAWPMDPNKLLDLYATFKSNYGIPVWFLFDDHKPLYLAFSPNVTSLIRVGLYLGNFFNGFYREDIIGGEERFVRKLTASPNYKIMLTLGLGEPAKMKASEIALAVQDKFGKDFSIAVSNNAIEASAYGVSKGITLRKYCEEHGIAPDEVLVCGDSGNDLTMFENFPHSFAMAHSPLSFQSQANHVISRLSDLKDYLSHPEKLGKDAIKPIGDEKTLENPS
jgi:Cof subfamily protein (haloacid dehalogenase superfamily)